MYADETWHGDGRGWWEENWGGAHVMHLQIGMLRNYFRSGLAAGLYSYENDRVIKLSGAMLGYINFHCSALHKEFVSHE